MSTSDLKNFINSLWKKKDSFNTTDKEARKKNQTSIDYLDVGNIRICEKKENSWITNEWIKKAILLSLRLVIIQYFQVVCQMLGGDNIPGLTKSI